MARGICVNCGESVGGFFGRNGGTCPGCGKVYCISCAQKTGMIFKVAVCPKCGRELKDAGWVLF